MLGKMILQGLGAAAIVATAASVYSASAQTTPPDATPIVRPAAPADNGYLSADRGGKAADQTKSRRSHHDDDDDDDDDHHSRHHDRRDSGDRDGRK
ncbi:hypothetical protein [Magnetospirillum fulvum]|jgi:hypothetical protein|uniref:Uncharacterized protein n=1 Tax=Magnetospirillum fulvum MGU-K5 TaxID=1316936 RepID=S9TJJ5_MAGFU|nr:hypothetical protein [Magnetospirillum fulvum]EPY02431.1 hypothetical protein K678_06108 [Magnetospirillum fulvum MGU-K5]